MSRKANRDLVSAHREFGRPHFWRRSLLLRISPHSEAEVGQPREAAQSSLTSIVFELWLFLDYLNSRNHAVVSHLPIIFLLLVY
jgi:hypothetical protein